MRRPLELNDIEFVNSTKDGTVLSGPTQRLRRLQGSVRGLAGHFQQSTLRPRQRISTASTRPTSAPDGSTLGSVDDVQTGRRANTPDGDLQRARRQFGGRRFLPGMYTVNFYLNGQYFAQRKFRVVADRPPRVDPAGIATAAAPARRWSGSARAPDRLRRIGSPSMSDRRSPMARLSAAAATASRLELRLRPQPNGFLHGELVIT